jgi:hypothetical protein
MEKKHLVCWWLVHRIVNGNMSGAQEVNSNMFGAQTNSPFRQRNNISNLDRFPDFVPTTMGGLRAIKGPASRPY